MRVHLQDVKNSLYYTGQDGALGGVERALNFANVGCAAKVAQNEQLTEMQIIVRYESVAGEVRLPVLPEWCEFYRH